MNEPAAAMSMALGIVVDHLTWVSTHGKAGRRQDAPQIRTTLQVIRTLARVPGERGRGAKEIQRRVREATPEELLEEAAKYPELRDALASLEDE